MFARLQSVSEKVRVTPPPPNLVREDVLAGVLARAEMVADALGLNGAASLEALMHAESADLVIIEANAIPDISPSSDLYQQVPSCLSHLCMW
ncbi:MAG: hypothetical protein H7Z11_16035 [Verrucomicrobia bacterium]|nr:hypothetical protein [Leptolyngbya sp. ES-bin-22]